MSKILDTYNRMIAGEQEKVAEEQVQERLEFLEKVASFADEALANEFGDDYSADDVVELSQMIIDDLANEKTAEELVDEEELELEEKVAELLEMGQIIAQGFKAELARED